MDGAGSRSMDGISDAGRLVESPMVTSGIRAMDRKQRGAPEQKQLECGKNCAWVGLRRGRFFVLAGLFLNMFVKERERMS